MSACRAPLEDGISDPYEASNRQAHEINKSLDKNIIRPMAIVYGDIAPIKVHLGMNVPMTEYFNLNVRGRYIAAKVPFLSNPLRDPSRADGGEPDYFHEHFVGDVSMNLHYDIATLNFSVYNITNADYNHPGDGEANAGDGWVVNEDGSMDTTVRATGYRNSLVPQALRSFMVTLKLDL